jgi:hypothetical protein
MILAGAAALACLAGPAGAQTPADRDDVRCMLVLAAVAKTPKQTEEAAKGTFYYLGRLESHGLGAKLGPMLIAEAKTIQNAAQAEMELKRCVAELNKSGQDLSKAFAQVRAAAPKPAAAAPKKK